MLKLKVRLWIRGNQYAREGNQIFFPREMPCGMAPTKTALRALLNIPYVAQLRASSTTFHSDSLIPIKGN